MLIIIFYLTFAFFFVTRRRPPGTPGSRPGGASAQSRDLDGDGDGEGYASNSSLGYAGRDYEQDDQRLIGAHFGTYDSPGFIDDIG